MKKIANLFILLCTLSCTDIGKSPEPDNLFTKEKMAAILTDLYIVEGAIASNKTAYLQTGVMPSSYIYSKYKIDSVTFKENFDYYTDRIDEYMIVLDEVQSNLKNLQDTVSARQEAINKSQKTNITKNKLSDSSQVTKTLKVKK